MPAAKSNALAIATGKACMPQLLGMTLQWQVTLPPCVHVPLCNSGTEPPTTQQGWLSSLHCLQTATISSSRDLAAHMHAHSMIGFYLTQGRPLRAIVADQGSGTACCTSKF